MKCFQKFVLLGITLISIPFSQSTQIPNELMKKNEIRNIPIFIDDVIDLYSMHLTIIYDATVIQYIDINIDPLEILGNEYIPTQINDDVPGRITFGLTTLASDLFAGSVRIAEISFQSIGQLGEFSIIELEDVMINQVSGHENTVRVYLNCRPESCLRRMLEEIARVARRNAPAPAPHSRVVIREQCH